MICVIIKGPSFKEAQKQLDEAKKCSAELVELRLDYFSELVFDDIKQLQKEFTVPMIFTLRSSAHGGVFLGAEEERLNKLIQLAELKPAYLDIEIDLNFSWIEDLFKNYPSLKLIISSHNLPLEQLSECFTPFMKIKNAFYKFVTPISNVIESLKLMHICSQFLNKGIFIGLGELGELTRILGKRFGAPIAYSALNRESINLKGQLTIQELKENFSYESLNQQTAVCGLIGHSLNGSVSDLMHNFVMQNLKLNAVYVKMPIQKHEMQDFFKRAKELSFKGLSVTMPLKEEVIHYLDTIDPYAKKIGAVNTITFTNGKMHGSNTDGPGALNALEKIRQVKGQKILILGAGGTARAIAYEAIQRGALVTILNRNAERSKLLASELKCKGDSLSNISHHFEEGYEVIINSTPEDCPIDVQWIIPGTTLMDIKISPKDSKFIQAGIHKCCEIVYGKEMYIAQAIMQLELWFPFEIDPKEALFYFSKKGNALIF